MRLLKISFLTPANWITLLRILLIFPFVISLLKMGNEEYGYWMRMGGIILFIVMAVSDAVDGYLARVTKQMTQLGAFLDPLADKLMITCASIILSVPETAVEGFQLPLTVVVLIIGKDLLLLLGFILTYFLTGKIHIRPVWAGKGSTFLQIAMVFSVLIGPEMVQWFSGWRIVTACLWWSAAVFAVTATFIYIYRGFQYIEEFDTANKTLDG